MTNRTDNGLVTKACLESMKHQTCPHVSSNTIVLFRAIVAYKILIIYNKEKEGENIDNENK
jgi:hypothetical protein